jgi:hypothetical protein
MDHAFPAASVFGFERLIPTVSLPDPDDRHVLAAAIHARADQIVTVNLKDFPTAALSSQGIVAAHPDPFVDYLFDLDEPEAVDAVARMRGRLRAPSLSADDFIDSIAQVWNAAHRIEASKPLKSNIVLLWGRQLKVIL